MEAPADARASAGATVKISVRSILGGFHQLQEDTAGILRVDEVDAGIGGSPLGLREQQPEAALTQDGTHVIQVVHAVGELLDAGAAVAVQPFRDGGVLVEGARSWSLGVLLALGPVPIMVLRNALLLR